MGKNVGLTYVSEFSFPKEQGFTGSASPDVHKVRGYMRGGHVKTTGTAYASKADKNKYGEGGYYGKPGDKYPTLKSGPRGKQGKKMPKGVKAKGGVVKKQMGGYMGPEREISVDDVKISVPKKHGGKMSTHDKLYHEGGKMGYAYGGQVKDTSSEFVEKSGKQKSMDYGNQPARRGRNQAEIEAGGTKRLKPGLNKGGYMKGGVHKVRASARRKASGRGMPKGVKARGGLMEYAHGGYAAGDKKSHPTGRGRKPYTGYNKQAGGSGVEDARYMGSKKSR